MLRPASSATVSARRLLSGSTTALVIGVLGVTAPAARQLNEAIAPSVPTALQVPAGHTAVLVASAAGTQNYICLADQGGFAWTFLGPQATLFNAGGVRS